MAVNNNHVFDSSQTKITVGPQNMRYPFDTEESIFFLYDRNPDCLRAKGQKVKPS